MTLAPKPDITLAVLSSPVAPEARALITVGTRPAETCGIDYHRPDESLSHAAGLEDTVADAQGLGSWTGKLHMGDKTPPSGTGRIYITVDGVWKEFDITLK